MTSLKVTLDKIYLDHNFPSSQERRAVLISEMELLEKGTIHCYTCPGTCCTFSANSMQITPIEALEILVGLKIHECSDEEKKSFKASMSHTISNYRLDIEVYTGKKNSSTLRKNYTCPFFNNGSLGCGLSRSIKPYGCLGFNPKTSEDNGKSCASSTELLEKREDSFLTKEEKINLFLKTDLKLTWSKLSIPEALISVMSASGI